jgi:hypothetical protein
MKLLLPVLFIFYSLHSFSQKSEKPKDSISKNDEFKLSLEKSNDSINLILKDSLNPSMMSEVNKLDDVFIKSKSEFNAVSLGIIDKEIIPPTQYERQLYTAGDFKPIHLLGILGGSLKVDPIINAISGRTKRLKKYIQFEKKESNLSFLENHFKDYMLDDLAIEELILGRFLNFLVENENLQNLIDRKDFGALYFFIGDEWFKFQDIIDNSKFKTIDNFQD